MPGWHQSVWWLQRREGCLSDRGLQNWMQATLLCPLPPHLSFLHLSLTLFDSEGERGHIVRLLQFLLILGHY